MQFDHKPGEKKIGNLGRLVYTSSLKKIKEEIEKCDVVCANCHSIITFERLTQIKVIDV